MSVVSLRAWYHTLRLRARLTLQIVLLSTAGLGLVLPVVLSIQARALHQTAQEKGFSLVRVFAFGSVQGVATDDFLALRDLVRSIARQPEVRYAMILDLHGRVLMHSRAEYAGKLFDDPLTSYALEAGGPVVQDTRSSAGEPIQDFAAPVLLLGERRAVARIGISFESEQRILNQTRNAMLGVGLLTLLAGLCWVRFHVGSLARPIQAMAHGARAVAEGELDRRIPIERPDELGEMAEAFNRMAQSLSVRFEVDRELSATLNLEAVLGTLVRHARQLVEAGIAFLAYQPAEASTATVVSTAGARGAALHTWQIVPGQGIAGMALAAGQATSRLDSCDADAHEAAVIREEGVASWFLVPIRLRQACVGLLAAAYRHDGPRGAGRGEALQRLADQAAVAIANARAYREIEELTRTLEVKVATRTRELSDANQALEASQERLKELDRLKSDFVSNVSHELRTPLATIRVSVENLLDGIAGEMNPALQRSLTRVKDNTDRLVRLITDLLDLSRIESGKVEVRLGRIAVAPVITEVLEEFRPSAAHKNLRLCEVIERDGIVVIADADKLHQILVNLVGNAVKFTPPDGTVTVAAAIMDGSGPPCAAVSVTDTGDGIPPDEVSAIFDKFYQVRHDGRRKTPGTGLGLAIAKSLVELQHGRIWAESTPTQGSRFTFTLPLADPSAKEGGAE